MKTIKVKLINKVTGEFNEINYKYFGDNTPSHMKVLESVTHHIDKLMSSSDDKMVVIESIKMIEYKEGNIFDVY